MNKDKIKYIYFLTQIKNLGNVRIKHILTYYPEAFSAFNVSKAVLKKIEGIDEKSANSIFEAEKYFKKYEVEFEQLVNKLMKNDIRITSLISDNYPKNLKKIYDAPIILFYKGNLTDLDKYSLSIIGTRTPTVYGQTVCENLTAEITKLGIMTVSGMARGIDSIAHKTTLKYSGLTYAILGSGVDVIYPPENRSLYNEILNTGAVISEYEPGAKPDKINFPKRNRIISGISLGTLIIETAKKGGSLITSEFALDQNKEVFAIPGNINSKKSEGTNELIKKGTAKLVTNIDDILSELNYALKPILNDKAKENEQHISVELDIFERKIFEELSNEPIHIDRINELTGMSISDCLVHLLSLEFKNVIKQLPGKYFVRM
jgi:DNA processing protein